MWLKEARRVDSGWTFMETAETLLLGKNLKQTFKYFNRVLVSLSPHLSFTQFICLVRGMQVMQVNLNFPNKQIKMIIAQLIFSIRQEPPSSPSKQTNQLALRSFMAARQ